MNYTRHGFCLKCIETKGMHLTSKAIGFHHVFCAQALVETYSSTGKLFKLKKKFSYQLLSTLELLMNLWEAHRPTETAIHVAISQVFLTIIITNWHFFCALFWYNADGWLCTPVNLLSLCPFYNCSLWGKWHCNYFLANKGDKRSKVKFKKWCSILRESIFHSHTIPIPLKPNYFMFCYHILMLIGFYNLSWVILENGNRPWDQAHHWCWSQRGLSFENSIDDMLPSILSCPIIKITGP